MDPLGWLKPEYLYQPRRLLRRLLPAARAADEFLEVRLAWGDTLRVRPGDAIGHALGRFGVYDLALSEALWRLVDPGETAVDVGANIGYAAALMAARLGGSGHLIAFEAHPAIHRELAHNVERLKQGWGNLRFESVQAALSDAAGTALLVEPEAFLQNRGTARVAGPPAAGAGERRLEVPAARLDDALAAGSAIGVMKIDVEGHEAQVLRGGARLLAAGRIRDIVFEESTGYPSAASALLEGAGYEVFALERTLLGPRLAPPRTPRKRGQWQPVNLLATRAAARARARFAPRGWTILR